MLSNQVTQLERERERTTSELSDAKDRIRRLQDQLTDSQQEAENAHLEHKALKAEFESYRREMTNRLEDSSEFLEELARQTDHLRQNELEKMPKHGSLTDRIIQLEDEVDRLQIENRELRTHCDDLQAQLLHNSVECGRSLLGNGSQPSLAAELNGTNNGGMDEQKLLNIIKEQDIDNQKLRNYINGKVERVLDREFVFARNELERLSLRKPSTRSAAPPPQEENQNLMKRLYSSFWTLKERWSGENTECSVEGTKLENKGEKTFDIQKTSK
uniref:Uncharacterized protein n=1 Tax=Meloidogyne javanica TaxID=6303 RepID=A0A915M6B2_MELJA